MTSTTARVLLDSASQRTFMTKNLAKQLNLKSEHQELLSVSTFAASKSADLNTYVIQFHVELKDGTNLAMFANVLPQITNGIQRTPLLQKDIEFLKILPKEKLADFIPCTLETTQIDLLIGSDYFWNIVGGDKIVLPSGMFMLPSTLGYVITGRYPNPVHQGGNPSTLLAATRLNPVEDYHSVCCSVNISLDKHLDLEKFWSLESIGITDPIDGKCDDEILEKFDKTVGFVNGRYQVTFPWKSDKSELPDNSGVALRRLKSLVHRLKGDSSLLQSYNNVIQQQLSLGIIETVQDTNISVTNTYYLPHHPVLTPSKTTTKIRILYDASSKEQCGMNSLNECLYRGPVILPDMVGLLLRFRTYPVVVLADIEKAFLQVAIQEVDRDMTRFYWLKDPGKVDVENNLCVFRFCRVPFGLICSPFLLAATIKFHLQKEGTPLALHILHNIYVDNVLIGLESVNDIYGVYEEAKHIFKKAAINLREWNSNCLEFLKCLADGERSTTKDFTKVLGLLWDPVDDTISVSGVSGVSKNTVTTKRDVLHNVAKIFDPLGLFSPITLHGKLFLQKLWIADQSWDEPICSELNLEWNEVLQLLMEIPSLRIPRIVKSMKRSNQLLIFCDASTKAYATVIYLRIKDKFYSKSFIFKGLIGTYWKEKKEKI